MNEMPSTQYTRHPLPVRLLNRLAPLLRVLHIVGPLETEGLIRRARKKTGLENFGDETFRRPLDVLVKSINAEANLSTIGSLIMQKRLVDALATRLEIEALIDRYPEILAQEPPKIIVIAGLQRTGTTLLHRLLGSGHALRAPLSWEVLNPVPLANEVKAYERNGNWPMPHNRIRQAKLAERGLKFLSPQFFAIHPIEHDMPEEDILLLDLSFMSQTPEATLHVPTYARWLEDEDPAPAYEYLVKVLKVLKWHGGGDYFILKSPHHLEHLDTIQKVFSDPLIIQTHRDPQKTLASFLSMVTHGTGVFSDRVDPLAIAEHWRRKILLLLKRSQAVRDQSPAGRFVDVQYADLVSDPLAVLATLYVKIGLPFEHDARASAQALLRRQKKDKYGRHSYDAGQFGLTAEDIERDFRAYRETYGIPVEETDERGANE